ncbi:MAG: hypothetical protein EP317_02415 [Bacillota bacterium]|nr:MAG: hypothetical protein EP317_02415 [Bacillota bacterium]
MKKILKILVYTTLLILLSFFLILIRLQVVLTYDINLQKKHMDNLEELYEDEAFEAVDENSFYDFLITEDLKMNEIQYLASHNSYKKRGLALGHFFVGLGSSKEEAQAMNYENKLLTDQLKQGIRSFEFDVRKRNDTFMLTHVPLVDNSSVAPNLKLALEEVKLFSDYNPNHLPIIILLEVKDDWMMLDPSLDHIGSTDLFELDQMIDDIFSNKLIVPSTVMHDSLTLRDSIQTHGWPNLQDVLGKVMFVLHAGSFVEPYVSLDPTLSSLHIFPSVYSDQVDESYAAFVIENNPFSDIIPTLVSNHFMIRTRIDTELSFDDATRLAGIQSGAQILTSDFSIARKDLSQQQIFYLDSSYTLRKRD